MAQEMTTEEEEEKKEGLLDKITGALTKFYTMLGVEEEEAKKYAAWTFWGLVAIIALVVGFKVYKLVKGY